MELESVCDSGFSCLKKIPWSTLKLLLSGLEEFTVTAHALIFHPNMDCFIAIDFSTNYYQLNLARGIPNTPANFLVYFSLITLRKLQISLTG